MWWGKVSRLLSAKPLQILTVLIQLAIIPLMPTPAVASADPDWCVTLTRTQDPDGLVNVRSGPGTDYDRVAESPARVKFWVDRNSAVRDPSTGFVWFEGYATSSGGSGFAGWIRSDFLDLTECTSTPPDSGNLQQ